MIDYRKIANLNDNINLEKLLSDNDLKLPKDIDDSLGLFKDGELIGCGFLKGNMIQGLAIDRRYQDEGLSVILITKLIKIAANKRITHLVVFTKPNIVNLIESIGFRVIADASPYAVFLEYGDYGVETYINQFHILAKGKPSNCASIVMNCNPFTKGHRYLIEQASNENEFVYIFAVEEDKSIFPFPDRLKLMREGTIDLSNVLIIPGGKYIISDQTFPSYFSKDSTFGIAHSTMDASIFATIIAPALNITKRYVGTEPNCDLASIYNDTLKNILPLKGIEVVEVERVTIDGIVISASKVREYIKKDRWREIMDMVPLNTYNYLKSEEGQVIIKKLKLNEN